MDEETKKRLEADFLANQNEPWEKIKDFMENPWKYNNLAGAGVLAKLFLADGPKKNEDKT